MSDIVEWLESQAGLDDRYQQAADEIERLQRVVDAAVERIAGYQPPEMHKTEARRRRLRDEIRRELEDSDG
ncbi:MAG: hypothetical protein AMJ65_09635 [Phycisphaerae bacterium SG8_4]|nr:MAG: hypothetical protein AMJ65_09635 [Phycisphaerae bacterium SG8_4]